MERKLLAKSALAVKGVSLQKEDVCVQLCGVEDVRQEKSLDEMKRIVRRIEREGRTNSTEQWWASETLATSLRECLFGS